MLRLKKVEKIYKVASTEVKALNKIDISFRANEFVSVLGPSGCGKTTLLNLIGGLDSYTSGDLFINGRSTKEFKDRDWDVYRNHRIGFIFQSYNLIPHQTILGNVELALTIAGLSKSERVEKAKQALNKVGLSSQYYKKSNQLSGGQCQRVAIARALVNDPEILLADEPTGALDTETSVQIMELIKNIAKERLVIMVTHNPELAEKYSTRIVRLLDGNILSDSNPYPESEEEKDTELRNNQEKQSQINAEDKKTKKEKAKMSFFTAFKLSLQNLFSKKARTSMTAIAGSIGIIGVSLVLALSYGIKSYISNMQNDMLSGNPIVISKTAFDMTAMMSSSSNSEKRDAIKFEDGYINVDSIVKQLIESTENIDGAIVNNNITEEYVKFINEMPSEYIGAITYDYGLDLTNNLFVDFQESADKPTQNLSLATLRTIYTSILKKTPYADYATLITTLEDTFMQAPKSEEYILAQYDVVEGKYAENKNEIMIVLNNDGMISDLLLAQLGYYTQEEFTNLIYKAGNSPLHDSKLDVDKFSYQELIGREFVWYPNDTLFESPAIPLIQPFTYKSYYENSFTGGVPLSISGILTPKEGVNYGSLATGFYYTEELTKHVLEENNNSEVAKFLIDHEMDSYYGMKQDITIDVGGNEVTQTINLGITFNYSFSFEGVEYKNQTEYLGKSNAMLGIFGKFMGSGETTSINALSLEELGGSSLPSIISIYPNDFQQKKLVLNYLDKWNEDAPIIVDGKTINFEDRSEIMYTDTLSLIISMITSMVDIITVALIGFTALSLVVSTVMIAIITYVSVVERIKEIGVIRSLGGRKRDVSYLFNAETVIIGFVSGAIGIIVTYGLSALINLLTRSFIQIDIAIFPISYAVIMMALSILLNLISGLMPSRSAAKKDPVVALRTE